MPLTTRLQVQMEVGRWLTQGWLVGRVRVEEATLRLTRCVHDTPAPDPDQLGLLEGTEQPI